MLSFILSALVAQTPVIDTACVFKRGATVVDVAINDEIQNNNRFKFQVRENPEGASIYIGKNNAGTLTWHQRKGSLLKLADDNYISFVYADLGASVLVTIDRATNKAVLTRTSIEGNDIVTEVHNGVCRGAK